MMDGTDKSSIAGKFAAPEAQVDVLIVGAGPAGIAAANELARAGLSVMLVDENPVEAGLIGLDVPHYFGGRAGAAVQNKDRMVEQIFASEPALEAAMEAGVDLQLGVACWGVFLPGPATRALPGPVAGLSDDRRVWTVGFARIIIATGARDFVAFFDGADQPGVMGASAFHMLVTRYDAFDGERLVIFGSGDLALTSAELALAKGLEVAALVEVAPAPPGSPERIAALAERGVPVLWSHVIKSAVRGATGVTGAEIVSLTDGSTETLACDTICLAVGRVPVIELFDAAGVPLALDGTQGGFIPASADGISTGSPLVFGAGDCMGVAAQLVAREDCERHGRMAARAVLASFDLTADQTSVHEQLPADTEASPHPPTFGGSPPPQGERAKSRQSPCSALSTGGRARREAPGEGNVAILPEAPDQLAYRRRVMEVLLATSGMNVLACQCEEVTRADLLSVRQPRYLGPPPDGAQRDLAAMTKDGPLSHDQMKRLTRVSMGPCQARRCREQVAMLMAIGGNLPADAIPLAGYRAPVRPLPLTALASLEETEAMTAHWPVWFSIASQWIPYDIIGTDEEADFVDDHTHL